VTEGHFQPTGRPDAQSTDPATLQPNILLIVTDQHQYAAAGPAAGGWSPRLEKLACEGAWFRRGYTVTVPCSPARASLFTGLYPHRHGMLNNCTMPFAVSPDVRPDCDAWGQRLMDAGYRTRYVGKWHAGVARGPVDYGFDIAERPFDADAYRQREGIPSAPRKEADIWHFTDVGGRAWPLYGRTPGPPDASPTAMQAAATVEVLRDLVQESSPPAGGSGGAGPTESLRPWCIWTNFTGPHEPYAVPEPYASMFGPHTVPLPASFHDLCEDKPAYVRRTRQSWFGQITEEHARRAIAHYRGYCAMIDHYVGTILDVLEQSGQADNTLVVFTTDHADMLGAHGLWFKDAYGYEESHHVPLLLRWPAAIRAGTVIDAYARTLDLGPTFLEAAGAAPLDPCHGTSLLPLLRGESGADQAPERRELFLEEHGNFFNFTLRAVADGRHKLVWNAYDFDELYDLEDDPHERRNLARDPAHAQTYQRMCDLLWTWMARVDDPYASDRFGASVVLPRGVSGAPIAQGVTRLSQ